jgi:phytoene dehydrogenase-like protein
MASPSAYDAIIIGANPDGLAAALRLAERGRSVLLIDEREAPGSIFTTEEFYPGFRADLWPRGRGWFHPGLAARLDPLLETYHPGGISILSNASPPFTLPVDPIAASEALQPFSERDASRYPPFVERMDRFRALLRKLYENALPEMGGASLSELMGTLTLLTDLRRLGSRGFEELLRTIPIGANDLLNEWFTFEPLKVALALPGIISLKQGVRSMGTAFGMLHHNLAPETQIMGGLAMIIKVLMTEAVKAGVEVRPGVQIDEIIVKDDSVRGIVLAEGEKIAAPVVLSAEDPERSLLHYLQPEALPPEFREQVRHIRSEGVIALAHAALNGLPNFTGLDESALGGPVIIAETLMDLERAYDAAKYGRTSAQPVLEIRFPSVWDSSMVETPGSHVMTVLVQYVPYLLRNGRWDEDARKRLLEQVIRILSDCAPDLPDKIIHARILTPLDLEQRFHLTGGHPFGGDMALDQILMLRPLLGYADGSTPVKGLYLCGPGVYPGGGHPGASGWLMGNV